MHLARDARPLAGGGLRGPPLGIQFRRLGALPVQLATAADGIPHRDDDRDQKHDEDEHDQQRRASRWIAGIEPLDGHAAGDIQRGEPGQLAPPAAGGNGGEDEENCPASGGRDDTEQGDDEGDEQGAATTPDRQHASDDPEHRISKKQPHRAPLGHIGRQGRHDGCPREQSQHDDKGDAP